MITEDYVSFETAKLLKEKGFDDEYTNAFYDKNGNLYFIDILSDFYEHPDNDTDITASTLYMTMKWLREVHKLHIAILWDCGAYIGKNSFYYHIDRMDNYEDKGYNKIGFDSYEEACKTAIKYCLENLV